MSRTSTRRYRNDPEYRERARANVRQRTIELIARDPRYQQLFNLRKKICRLRDSIAHYMHKAGLQERRLIVAIAKRDKLASILKGRSNA